MGVHITLLEMEEGRSRPINTHSFHRQPENKGLSIWTESIFKKLFEGEMFIQSLPTTLLQIFGKIIPNFQVIDKSIKDPDENFLNNSQAWMG